MRQKAKNMETRRNRPYNILMSWHARLRKVMKIRDMTGTQLADRLGVGTSSISDWTRGKKEPRYDMLVRICKELDIEVGSLFSECDANGSELEVQAFRSFTRALTGNGPLFLLARLQGLGLADEWGRDLGRVETSTQSVRHHERPDWPNHPSIIDGPKSFPETPCRPPEVEFQDLASEADSLSGPERERKPG